VGTIQSKSLQGANHPPKNKTEVKADIKSILQYSPKKNIAKIIDEYSILYPATISASASGKSKGALFVSASTAIKNNIHIGHSRKKNQTISCLYTMSVIFKDPESKITGNIHILIEIS